MEALDRGGVRYLVAGGLAVAAHGYLRFTKDVDIAVALDGENVERLFTAIAGLGYRPTVPVTAGEIADPETRARLVREKNMLVLNFHSDEHRATPVDVFVTEPFDFAAEHELADVRELRPGLQVRFLRRSKLIELKRASGRAQDLADAEELQRLEEDGE